MKARVFYFVEHLDFGDTSQLTGWWLMRATAVETTPGKGFDHITDRTRIAKFDTGNGKIEDAFEADGMSRAVAAGTFHIMPKGWMLRDVERIAGKP